jgi:hypothetical protein
VGVVPGATAAHFWTLVVAPNVGLVGEWALCLSPPLESPEYVAMLTPVLSSFGFHAQAFWWPDTALLAIVFGVFLLASYLVLEIFVKERR